MTILHIPAEASKEVFAMITQPVEVIYVVKIKEQLSPEFIEQLDQLGVHYLTKVE